MKPQSPLAAAYRLEMTDRPGHRIGPFVSTCEAVLGYPKCWTAVNGGAHGEDCSCPPFDLRTLKPVTEEQHAECEGRGWEAYRERNGSPCDDCAMRPGSPEVRDELAITISEQKVPFRCHQGMPMRFVGEREDDGTPRVSYDPRNPSHYPPCNGWAFFRALGSDDEAVVRVAEVAG